MRALLMVALLAPSAALAGVRGAVHDGTWSEGGVRWESTFWLDGPGPLALAVPLPVEATVRGATPVRGEDGRIVALEVAETSVARVHVTEGAAADALHPPLVVGDAVQRITLDGAAFRPDPSIGLERNARYWKHDAVRRPARKELDRIAGKRPAPWRAPIYLAADARLVDAGGLVGRIVPSGRSSPALAAVIAVGFATLVGALALLYRLLERGARWERAQAYIERELGREDAP